jgi:hypothetical protein
MAWRPAVASTPIADRGDGVGTDRLQFKVAVERGFAGNNLLGIPAADPLQTLDNCPSSAIQEMREGSVAGLISVDGAAVFPCRCRTGILAASKRGPLGNARPGAGKSGVLEKP